MDLILNKLPLYILEKYNITKKTKNYPCPFCYNETDKTQTALMGLDYTLKCYNPNCPSKESNKGVIGNVIDIVRLLEPDRSHSTDDEILEYLSKKYTVNIVSEKEAKVYFEYYKKNNFDLVQLANNQKIPIELNWTKINHKEIHEWDGWYKDQTNFGVKTGELSGITVIDIDQKPIPAEIKVIIDKYPPTLCQETNNGYHYFYVYDKDFPKTRIDTLKIDIENNGGQVVIPPSIINNIKRKMALIDIQTMPEELKKFLMSKISLNKTNIQTLSEQLQNSIKNVDFDLTKINEGNRTNSLMALGGVLRKELNIEQTAFVLQLLNNKLCKPTPLQKGEILNIVKSLDRYINVDENELAKKIYEYLKMVGEADSKDISITLGLKKELTDKILSNLTKDNYIFKRRRVYIANEKVPWKIEWGNDGQILDYDVPYFHDKAVFRSGDMMVLGGKSGVGKTHVALNIIKRLIVQKNAPRPHYISLESGNRFVGVAKTLGLVEGDFSWTIHYNPESIELEKDTVTILDWLLPSDYSQVDKLYKHFSEQLSRKGGLLIVFTQLKDDGAWFAENMLKMFPALTAKFLYEDEQGKRSYFETDKIRESKTANIKYNRIPLVYDWHSRQLFRVDELTDIQKTQLLETI